MNSYNRTLRLITLLLVSFGMRSLETEPNKITGDMEALSIANEYIHEHLDEWGLTANDLIGMTVNDMYTDKSSGITRIYFLQHYKDIPVYNAIINVNITKEGKVFNAGNRFVPGLEDKVSTYVPVLSPQQAVKDLASYLNISCGELQLKRSNDASSFLFAKNDMVTQDIPVELSFQPYQGKVFLVWDILFAPRGTNDKWSTRIDAVTGIVLDEDNWTVHCFGENNSFSTRGNNGDEVIEPKQIDTHYDNNDATYNVWPAPMESPNDGSRKLVTNPADPIASPFGWHDFNGQPGAEFTVTCGNNAWAYQDRDNLGHSINDEPDGGPDLYFDFPYNGSWDPKDHVNASVVNAFYWASYMHDFAYHFGFDEAAGNFQQNNYGRGGVGIDKMLVVCQVAENQDVTDDPSYQHHNEGESGVLFLPEFTRRTNSLTILEPASVSGKYQTSIVTPGWGDGAQVTDVPVIGEVVRVNDGVEGPLYSDACEQIINAVELEGRIAYIDRGGCEFGVKALQAQNAGAIGVIIGNYDDGPIKNLQPGSQGENVHIPVVLISGSESHAIRPFIGNGLRASLVSSAQNGPESHDIALDNELIAHEYGHGISWRLCGGPDAACVLNDEQMDEGWSDFFGLVTTVKPGDTGEKKRGFSTYLTDEPIIGIRRYPYCTDMSVNPLTYGHVAVSQVNRHDVGEIWGNMLWDMYWAFVDKYGWNADPYNESSGNYKAIRLAFDGLKNLPCNPGYVDGRNAILAADETLYNGDDLCMLWKVFARRGLGFSADQGSPFDAGDQKEAFDVPPTCSNKILIEKSVTDIIQPGDGIQVTIKVGNYKNETATNVVVTDEIPEGTSFKLNSSNYAASLQGNTLSFDLGNMISNKEKIITYTLQSTPNAWSQRKFLDDVTHTDDSNWLSYSIGDNSSNLWSITNAYPAHSGDLSWQVKEIPDISRQALELNPAAFIFQVDGDYPVLRFYHRYQTKAGIVGGVVDVREVGTSDWIQVDEMIRNGYPGFISATSIGLVYAQAYSGNSGSDFKAAYVDLSRWTGKDIQIRFRFVTFDNTNNGFGWLIDDIEFMDLLSYNGEACVTTGQGDFECAIAPAGGTIVDSREGPLSTTQQLKSLDASIYPNPANDKIIIALSDENENDAQVTVQSIDGRVVIKESFFISGKEPMMVNTVNIPSGLYIVSVKTSSGQFAGKAVIQK